MTIDKKGATGQGGAERKRTAASQSKEAAKQKPAGRTNNRNGFLLLGFLALVTYSLFENGGLINFIQLQKELNSTNQEIRTAQSTIARLRQEIDILNKDKRYLESLAREDFGLVRKDEIIYQFHTPPPSK